MIIGITGNSGTGKTEIAKIFAKKINGVIIDADKIAKELSMPGNTYFEEIIKLFGEEVIENNKLNRKKIAEIIFNNNEKRAKLNDLTNKYVVQEIINEIKKNNGKNIVLDVPLLFESKLNEKCDKTIGIIAGKRIKIKRIIKRDNLSKKEAKKRLSIQQKNKFYKRNADLIVKNNRNLNKINLEEICLKLGMN